MTQTEYTQLPLLADSTSTGAASTGAPATLDEFGGTYAVPSGEQHPCPCKPPLGAPLEAPQVARAPLGALTGPLAQYYDDPEVGEPLTPRHYQDEMIGYLRMKGRALCYDPVGLGKTLEAAEAVKTSDHILVCVPNYLTEQWWEFLMRQYPEDGAAGRIVLAGELHRRYRNDALSLPYKWMIVNHEMIREYAPADAQKAEMRTGKRQRMMRSYNIPDVLHAPPDAIVFDEFHHFRGRKSAQSKGALTLASHPTVKRVVALTATPVYREPDDLFMQGRILWPDKQPFNAYWRFVEDYCITTYNGWSVVVSGGRRDRIEALMKAMGWGRTYAEVSFELPPLIRMPVIKIEFTKQEREAYHSLKYNYRKLIYNEDGTETKSIPLDSAGAVLHELRRSTLTPAKLAAVKEIVDGALASDNPNSVIFCWYRDTAAALTTALNTVGSGAKAAPRARPVAVTITGDVPATERVRLAKDRAIPIKVVTIAALSEGVDLSHMQTIVYAEEDYAPGSNEPDALSSGRPMPPRYRV